MPAEQLHSITPKEAEARGLRPLTVGYHIPDERWMLDAVLADMRAGGIEHAAVKVPGFSNYLEVWRTGIDDLTKHCRE